MTADEFFAGAPERFDGARAGDLRAVYAFELAGDGGGAWTLRVGDGVLTVAQGGSPDADATIRATADDWMAIVEGRKDPQLAFLTGKLKVSGNVQLALRLREAVL